MSLDHQEIEWLLKQVHFFNQQWKSCADAPDQSAFADLMLSSKDRCQLMLLKFASSDAVWARQDPDSGNGEWLIGGVGLPDLLACHIPLHTLKKQLSAERLNDWQIA